MAATPAYSRSSATYGGCSISTANANRDGTGTLGTVATAGASGGRISTLALTATGTTTAGMLRLYISDGTNHRLIKEISVDAITPAANTKAFAASLAEGVDTDCMPIILPPNGTLRASTEKGEAFQIVPIQGGDF